MTESVLTALVSALSRLSDSQLETLRHLLGRPRFADVLVRQVDSILAFRRAVPKGDSLSVEMETETERIRTDRVKSVRIITKPLTKDPRHFRTALSNLLSDRMLFPSTKDVLQAVNDGFGFEFRYDDFKKSGRRDLIRRCWSSLERLPDRSRRQALKNFLDKYSTSGKAADAYKELFRILTGNG